MKKWLLFASAMCLVFIIAACGANSATNNGEAEEAAAGAADSGAATSELVITASNWEFDQPEYKIKAGETVNLKLDSIDGMHGVTIEDTTYKLTSGKDLAVNITVPGKYEMVCNVPCGQGHRQMKSTLIVE